MSRFRLPDHVTPRPFIITGAAGRARFAGTGLWLIDPTDGAEADFCLAMNRGNCIAYDGSGTLAGEPGALGMPLWVLLDCCALPAGLFGIAVPRDAVPESLADAMDPRRALEWIGVTEYVALPSVQTGEVVGVSAFSFLAGGRWGQRTKAMALRALGARRQVGVTQYGSPGIALHLRFGPMCVEAPIAAVHSRPHETFVYSTEVPNAEGLSVLEGGGQLCAPHVEGARHRLDTAVPDVGAQVRALSGGRPTYLVGCGAVSGGRVPWVDVVVT